MELTDWISDLEEYFKYEEISDIERVRFEDEIKGKCWNMMERYTIEKKQER